MPADRSVRWPSGSQPILEPGRNCWRLAHAGRLAVIVDAAQYFHRVKQAMLEANHSIMLIAWDFDTRIRLEPDSAPSEVPDQLAAFIKYLTNRRPALRVYILKWNIDFFKAFAREPISLAMFDWATGPSVSIKLDWEHPPGACHHQKIVVIDDAIAFCGGIDMTANRWDTREHPDSDKRRVKPSGQAYGPWHDAAIAVDGEAARALGELARERWRRATGENLVQPPPAATTVWPVDLNATMSERMVAIARTEPEWNGAPQITEIETLYLDAIASGHRLIYLESQYFASRKVAEAVAARLREPEPPEIVVIVPHASDGWLEQEAMDTSRALFLSMIREADHAGRFHIYYPVTDAGAPIYVHAKITVIDERLLRVGSSNLNNRSMGYDTECDLAVEGEDRVTEPEITAFLNDLVAEHMGVEPSAVGEARAAEGGSLTAAIEALRRPEGRSLRPLELPEISGIETFVSENELMDPERPSKLSLRLIGWWRKLKTRRR